MSEYQSNTTPAEIADFLRGKRAVAVTTHAKPDGDALGSSLAVARALKKLGTRVEVWLVGPVPDWTDAVARETPVRRLSADNLKLPPASEFDPEAVVICDTGSWSQLDGLKEYLAPRRVSNVIIDHHLHGNADAADRRLIVSNKASATHAAAPVIDALLNLRSDDPYPHDIAEALFLGAATDTGWFRFSNTTADTMRFAARLLASGVDHPALYERIEQQQRPTRPALLGAALSSLRFEHHHRVGIMTIRDAELRGLGATGGTEETGGFAEPVLAVAGVQVVALLTEMPRQPDGRPLVKVSLRSKPGPNAVDVASIAHHLGGGGHARAAGVKLFMTLDEAVNAIVKVTG